ncbi:MAG: hypothetical protein L0Y71_09620 [Gemmataceae bacterium]|nr:hypothetical protein [Gemmataceae bacterium]
MNAVISGLLASLIANTMYSSQEGPGKVKLPKMVEMKTVHERLVMVGAMPEASSAGSEVFVKVDVKNQRNEDMRYVHRHSSYLDIGLAVHDVHGKAVPLTRFGQWAYGAARDGGSASLPLLKPEKQVVVHLNLARVFDLSLPGEYSLSVTWYFVQDQPPRNGVYLRIEKLRFRIVEEPR